MTEAADYEPTSIFLTGGAGEYKLKRESMIHITNDYFALAMTQPN